MLATKSTPRRTQIAHRATARAIRSTQSAQRVRFALSKCAPRHSESDLAESKWRACHEIYTQAPKYCACQNEPNVRQGQRKRRRRKHYDAPAKQDASKRPTTPGSQISMARQREHAAFQNTAPAQRNDTSSLRSYDSRTGPMNTALADPSKTRFHDEFQWHTLVASPRTVADGCGRLRTVANSGATPREYGLHPQTPTYKREPFATHSGKRKKGTTEQPLIPKYDTSASTLPGHGPSLLQRNLILEMPSVRGFSPPSRRASGVQADGKRAVPQEPHANAALGLRGGLQRPHGT